MGQRKKWENEEMWQQAVAWKRGSLTYRDIAGRLSKLENMKKFGLEEAPSEDTVRREVSRRLPGQPTSSRLYMRSPSVGLYTNGVAVARYVTLEVSSDVEARDCVAWARVLLPKLIVPLHWAGTPLTEEETSAPKMDIYSEKPARLDVAMALPPPGQSFSTGIEAMSSGSVSLYVPSHHGRLWDGKGCWLAQPVALYNTQPDLESYLPPGKYTIRVTVRGRGCGEVSEDFVLTSPTSWEGLDLKPA